MLGLGNLLRGKETDRNRERNRETRREHNRDRYRERYREQYETSPPRPPPKPRIPPTCRPAELDAWQPGKTREVAHIAEILRQVYELDIQIWNKRHLTNERDLGRARDLQTQSDELFAEIRRTVAEWEDGRAWKGWNDEELAEITQIRQIVYSFPAKRHDKGY